MSIRCRCLSTVLFLFAARPARVATPATRTDRRRIADRHRQRSERRHRAGRDRHRDQPGDERRPTPRCRTRPATTPSRRCRSARYVVKAELVELQDGGDQADPGRGDADRPHRLQAGARRACRRRSKSAASRRCCRPSRRRSARSSRARTLSALPLNGRNTGQLSLLLPGVVTPNPSSFTAIRNFGSGRPFVNGNREQTNNYTIDGVDMNETIDNLVAYQPSPDALAEISVETNNYCGRHRQRGRRGDQQRHQVRHELLSRQRLRVLPQQQHGRELLVEQPIERAQAGTAAGHLRRHLRRAAGEEQAVLLRQLSGHALRRAGFRDDFGRAGDVARGRSVEPDRHGSRSR